jgi:hypothetical protein
MSQILNTKTSFWISNWQCLKICHFEDVRLRIVKFIENLSLLPLIRKYQRRTRRIIRVYTALATRDYEDRRIVTLHRSKEYFRLPDAEIRMRTNKASSERGTCMRTVIHDPFYYPTTYGVEKGLSSSREPIWLYHILTVRYVLARIIWHYYV